MVEKHREALSAFFPVTPAKHFLISRGYVADERFRAHYEAQQEGLARWRVKRQNVCPESLIFML
nr:TipAS antibiotic-recognition domain-containing protein [Corynebacterium sp. Marseille-P4611]